MPTAPNIDSAWWGTDQPLSVALVMLAVAMGIFLVVVSLIGVREWWKLHRPYRVKLLELSLRKSETEIENTKKIGEMCDTIRTVEPQRAASLNAISGRLEVHTDLLNGIVAKIGAEP